MTLTFGSWVRNSHWESFFHNSDNIQLPVQVGIPAVPFVTIYKADQPGLAQMAGLGVVNPSVRLSCLPLWCVLRSLGQDQVITLIFFNESQKVKVKNPQTTLVNLKVSLIPLLCTGSSASKGCFHNVRGGNYNDWQFVLHLNLNHQFHVHLFRGHISI